MEYLLLSLIGLLAGVLGGLLGVGGSVIMIPGMVWLFPDPNQHLYQGAAMIVNFFVVLPAVIQHRRAGAILKPVVVGMIPAAMVSVLVGVWLSDRSWFRGANEVYLSNIFGLFLFYVVIYNTRRLFARQQRPEPDDESLRRIGRGRAAFAAGMPMGLLGGLLGIGGGSIAVPCQQVFLRLPLRRAIANSATSIIPLSLMGATYKNLTNLQAGIPLSRPILLAACLVPTAIIGGYIGGRLTHVAPRRALRIAFILLMSYAACLMLTR